MIDLPPQRTDCRQKSADTRDSAVAWKLGGAVLVAVGLVAGARVRGVPNQLLDPFGPVLLAIVALIGANVGALIGLLVSRSRQKRAAKSALNNSEASLSPPKESGDMPVKQSLRALAGLNAWITLGGLIGAFGGWGYLASPPPAAKSDPTMGMFNIILAPAALLWSLLQIIIFATAGALIGALIGSLVSILRCKR